MKWDDLAENESIDVTGKALEKNGMKVHVVENGKEAFKKVFELIPEGSEVMDLTSMTLEAIGVSKEIQEGTRYEAVRNKIKDVDEKEMRDAMRRHFSAVDYAVGSVHAVTEDGKLVIASYSGSQLAPYAFGAGKLIWVVGTQKIVKNLDEAFKRIEEYTYPLEDERAQKAYGMSSGISKILIVQKEINPERIEVILVKEKLGF